MRVLYVASAIEAGGASGGWTHVREVACGLSALGHQVLVVARRPPVEGSAVLGCNARLKSTRLPKWLAVGGIRQLSHIFKVFRPDAVMERFYNFAGAGVLLSHRTGVPSLLEVNAPMVDPAGSLKTRVDRLLFGAMRSWAVRQARWASAIVTPLSTTVPPEVNRGKIHELPWGANIERFDPALRLREAGRIEALRSELGLAPGTRIAVFLGSFRTWHGAGHFTEAARRMIAEGSELSFLAVGGGPELGPISEAARSWGLPEGRLAFAGARPHEEVPYLLAMAEIGVAPFDLEAYPPLREFGFYWSPLKVFEYMATGLPVVTINVNPLNEIVRHEQEGLLYQTGDINGLQQAIARLGSNPGLRDSLGRSARERVVTRYSWQRHCEALDSILRSITRG